MACIVLRFVIWGILGFGFQQRFAISAEMLYFCGREVEAVHAVEDMGDAAGEPAIGIKAAQVFKSGRQKIIHCNSSQISSVMYKTVRIKLTHILIIDINF